MTRFEKYKVGFMEVAGVWRRLMDNTRPNVSSMWPQERNHVFQRPSRANAIIYNQDHLTGELGEIKFRRDCFANRFTSDMTNSDLHLPNWSTPHFCNFGSRT